MAAVVVTGFLVRRTLDRRRPAAWDTRLVTHRTAMDWPAVRLRSIRRGGPRWATAPHSWQTRHAQQAGSPPPASSPGTE